MQSVLRHYVLSKTYTISCMKAGGHLLKIGRSIRVTKKPWTVTNPILCQIHTEFQNSDLIFERLRGTDIEKSIRKYYPKPCFVWWCQFNALKLEIRIMVLTKQRAVVAPNSLKVNDKSPRRSRPKRAPYRRFVSTPTRWAYVFSMYLQNTFISFTALSS